MSDAEESDDVFAVGAAEKTLKERAKEFDKVLDDLESTDDKKKRLWREIYENAIADRQNAYVMFTKLARIAKDNSSEHAVHGRTMATYIEKMSKANDQIIKLADLIAAAEIANETMNSEDLFNQINKAKK